MLWLVVGHVKRSGQLKQPTIRAAARSNLSLFVFNTPENPLFDKELEPGALAARASGLGASRVQRPPEPPLESSKPPGTIPGSKFDQFILALLW